MALKDPDTVAALCVQLSRMLDPRSFDSLPAVMVNPAATEEYKMERIGQAVQTAMQLMEHALTDLKRIANAMEAIAQNTSAD